MEVYFSPFCRRRIPQIGSISLLAAVQALDAQDTRNLIQDNKRMPLRFDREFEPAHGEPVELTPEIRRVTARNPGPFTFQGTNSYLVGTRSLAVIDPGPADESHLEALLSAIGNRPVTHILVTHTHRDHSPLAKALQRRTGAVLLGMPAPPEAASTPLDAGGDVTFRPDILLEDGLRIEGEDWALETVATPGHASNHLSFALSGTPFLFSGDHVMAWATTVVAPPDGSMSAFMASIDKLLARRETRYLPGHGGEVRDAHRFLRGLRAHRKMRERAVLERLAAGDRTPEMMARTIYRDTDPRLHGAAALSLLAHLEDLLARGKVSRDLETGEWRLSR